MPGYARMCWDVLGKAGLRDGACVARRTQGKPRELCPRLSIPLNTIIKLTPRTHDCEARTRAAPRTLGARLPPAIRLAALCRR